MIAAPRLLAPAPPVGAPAPVAPSGAVDDAVPGVVAAVVPVPAGEAIPVGVAVAAAVETVAAA
eukprot:10808895-Heterocapsa_arctica.AAC.1